MYVYDKVIIRSIESSAKLVIRRIVGKPKIQGQRLTRFES